ncbi:hypothetical protein V6N11_069101 [Hibiscus sabdariffa]|uniref:Uncharacterized protein n=1 Tax=Hibiscus sabdariffa TaxID=183260 RepID=A0ABR2A6W4_9ROSI
MYDILTHFQMENAKAISTPISSSDKLPPPEPSTTIDISSATYVCKNIVFHSCMKYLALDYFFVRDLIDAESLLVQYIPSKAQIADTLTKSLGRNLFHHFRPKVGVSDGSFILRGRIPSKAQIADTLTKLFGRNLFHHFRPKVGVSDGSFILRGRIKET